MLAASFIAIFIIPVTFYVVERLSHGKAGGAQGGDPPGHGSASDAGHDQ
jgi:HAE1 family hydrophobic/amphiphilic exporter-1